MVKVLAMIELNYCVVRPIFHTIAHVVKNDFSFSIQIDHG